MKIVLMMVLYALTAGTPALAAPTYQISGAAPLQTIDLIQGTDSASDFYDYHDQSGHPPFGTINNDGYFWLYKDNTTGDLSLGMIFDDATASLTGGHVEMALSGVPSGGAVILEDDPADTLTLTSGNWTWISDHTDGGIINGLEDAYWTITIDLTASEGINHWYFLEDGVDPPDNVNYICLNMTDQNLVISAVPIPGTVWLLASGLLGLMGLRRRV